jgi:hypothetical protein
MKLDSPATVTPPPYSDNSGNVTYPKPIVFNELRVSYTDTPYTKTLTARIESIPSPIPLFFGKSYEEIGDWTQAQAEQKLREFLGEDVGKTLRLLYPKTMEEDPNGPGTVLSKMIKSLGIVMSDSCACRRHAIEMNQKGNDWCESNIDTILGWLKEEAARRRLPFVELIGRVMVNRAIKKSRKLLANEPVPENDEDLDKE